MSSGVTGPLRAILFDLDNTLCDTEGIAAARFRAGLQALTALDGRWPLDQLMARIFALHSHWGRLPQLLEELGVSGTPAAQAARKAHDTILLACLQLLPGIPQALEELDSSFTLGIVTNGDSAGQRKKLRSLGLESSFSVVLVDEEVGWSKPDPRIFQAALDQARCPPDQALFVGDRWDLDVQGAVAAGMRAAWISPDSAHPPPGPEAFLILPSVAHLPEALRRSGLL